VEGDPDSEITYMSRLYSYAYRNTGEVCRIPSKGKSAIPIARMYRGRKKDFMGKNLGKRIVCVNGRAKTGEVSRSILGTGREG
jgi:hypothetical protein